MKESYIKSVAASGLFKYVPDSYYSKVWDELNMGPHNYHRDEIIYSQGAKVNRCGIVHSGLVKSELIHTEGTSSLAYYYAKGEVFAFEGALSGKTTSPTEISAEGTNTCVIFFDIHKIFACSFHIQIIKGLMELLANDDIKKLYRLEILSKKTIRERLLTYFKIMCSQGNDNSFTLTMSRQQLSSYLCVNRSALSNEINNMKREGIIDFTNKKYTIK